MRRLAKQYPSGTAPASVVDRYDKLLALTNAQFDWTNAAVRQYNKLLHNLCDPA